VMMQARNGETNSRMPAVAGRFYPESATECRRQAESFLDVEVNGEKRWIGGIVPHARWVLPGGESEVPVELQAKLTEGADLFAVEERLHRDEHAVEVEVPLIQLAFPGVAVLPIETPPIGSAEAMGRAVARVIRDSNLNAVYLASSDLTHYGPGYGFAPVGVGEAAMRWGKENDRRLLDLVEGMRIEAIVPEAKQRRSACGPGAIAAMMAACREHGATEGRVLRHATSYETLAEVHPQPSTNAVGYASVVVG
jgi:MEMO1 family protein